MSTAERGVELVEGRIFIDGGRCVCVGSRGRSEFVIDPLAAGAAAVALMRHCVADPAGRRALQDFYRFVRADVSASSPSPEPTARIAS
jgi:hypothetical protein